MDVSVLEKMRCRWAAHGRLADAEHVGRLGGAQPLGKRQQHPKLAAGQLVKPGEGLARHQRRLNRILRENRDRCRKGAMMARR